MSAHCDRTKQKNKKHQIASLPIWT